MIHRFALFLLLFINISIYADEIEVFNKTSLPINAAIYYYKNDAQIAGPIKEIPSQSSIKMRRPDRKLGYDRQLLFSFNKFDLTNSVSRDKLYTIGSSNVGTLQGSQVFIDLTKGHLAGHNYLEWKVIEPIKGQIKKGISYLDDVTLGQLRRLYANHQYGTRVARLRVASDICGEEKTYLANRLPRAKAKLENILGLKLQDGQMPKIALCGSGGGYRAMLNTLGSMIGAEDIGLLDSSIYISGLSGSTWALATWTHLGMPLQQFQDYLLNRIKNNFFKIGFDLNAVTQNLLRKFSFKQPISLVDIYGSFIAKNLLSGDINSINLANQTKTIEGGKWIMPIYTAIATKLPYEWVEFTPYEVGGDALGGYVPSWSFGRSFLNGQSQDFAPPPQTLGYLMGMWGSAFAANYKEVLLNFENNIKQDFIRNALKFGIQETVIGRQRAFLAGL